MNDRSGDGIGGKIRTNTAKFTNMIIARFRERAAIWSEKVRCSSKLKPRLREERVVNGEQLFIVASCCGSPMGRNSLFQRS